MAERAFIHLPFDGHVVMKPTGILMAKLKGEAGFINVGNYESVTYSFEFEEEDIYSPQAPERVKIATLISQADITLSMELTQLTPLFRQIMMQSTPGLKLDQAAVVAQVYTIDDALAGRIYRLPHRSLTAVAVEGIGDDYVEGVNYQFDASTGHLEIIAHPGMVEKADVSITYSAAAIVGRTMWGMLSNTDIRCELMFRSTNKYGPKQLVEFNDVKIRPDGDGTLGSNSTDVGSASFTGEVFADPTQPLEYQYGRVTDIA